MTDWNTLMFYPQPNAFFLSMTRLWISIWVCTCIPRNTVAKLVHRHRLWLWDVPYNNLVTLLMSFLVQCLVFWMQWTWGCLDGTWTSGLWLYLLCVVLFSSCASSCMVRIHGFELSLLVYLWLLFNQSPGCGSGTVLRFYIICELLFIIQSEQEFNYIFISTSLWLRTGYQLHGIKVLAYSCTCYKLTLTRHVYTHHDLCTLKTQEYMLISFAFFLIYF